MSEQVAGKAREAVISIDMAMQRNAVCDLCSHAKPARGIRIGSYATRMDMKAVQELNKLLSAMPEKKRERVASVLLNFSRISEPWLKLNHSFQSQNKTAAV